MLKRTFSSSVKILYEPVVKIMAINNPNNSEVAFVTQYYSVKEACISSIFSEYTLEEMQNSQRAKVLVPAERNINDIVSF